MSDLVSSRPVRFRVPALRLPALPFQAIGKLLADCAIAIGDAFSMAYVQPFDAKAGSAPDSEGREPRW